MYSPNPQELQSKGLHQWGFYCVPWRFVDQKIFLLTLSKRVPQEDPCEKKYPSESTSELLTFIYFLLLGIFYVYLSEIF